MKVLKISAILILLINFVLIACKSDTKKISKNTVDPIFIITAKSYAYKGNTLDLLQQKDSSFITLTEVKEDNGTFIIKSFKKYPEGIYYLRMSDHPKPIPFLLDNTDLQLHLDENYYEKSFVSGSSDVQKKYRDYLIAISKKEDAFPFQKKFIQENKNSVLGSIVLKNILGKTPWRLKETQALYQELDSVQQNSEIGHYIKQYIHKNLAINSKNEANKTKTEKFNTKQINTKSPKNKPVITEYAPYFYGNNTKGVEISAKQVFNRNKLTLVDFWASWCVPCRAQTPDLLRLYNKYHKRGFEILSVSEDKEDSNWNNAISQDNMNWLHVKDDYKRLANMYSVRTIPHAFLVDSQGGILAKKISPYKLELLLQQYFGN